MKPRARRQLSIAQAAARKNVSELSIRRRIWAGRLSAYQVAVPGKRWRYMIDPDDLDRCWAAEYTSVPAVPKDAA